MSKIHLLILTTLLSLCTSCRESDQERVARLVQEWQGKEIIFPEGLVFTRFVKDTVDYQIPESKFKVLVYVDSIGCISCKLQLYKWKSFIAHVDSATGGNVPFLFFFQSKDDKEIRYLLKRDNFSHLVCIDHDNRMNAKNDFPQEQAFQSFLLDKDNRVKVIGNPIHNLAIQELYLKHLTGVPQQKQAVTTLEAEQTEYDLGTVPTGTTKQQTVTIRNSGSTVFKLKGFTTSCDCTEATCDWQELQPGENGTFTVSYQAEEPGDFYRTVEIYGNIPDNALQFSFIGTVKKQSD